MAILSFTQSCVMRWIRNLIFACLVVLASTCSAQMRELTAMDVYAALGQDESSPAVESLLELLGGAVAGTVQTIDSPTDPLDHHNEHWMETANGAVVMVLDGQVEAVQFDLKRCKGRLPFGLRRGMEEADLAGLFPDAWAATQKPTRPVGGHMEFTLDQAGRLVQFTCLPPLGYCHTRGTHLAGQAPDSLAARAHERKKDYLARIGAMENRLRQSLLNNAAVIDTALAPKSYPLWAYTLGAKAGAFEPGKGIVIDFLAIGARRRVMLDPEELRDFLVHFPDAQVVMSCTPDRDDCTLFHDRLEVLQVAGRGYLLMPEFGMTEIPPHGHRGERAWHGE